MVDHSPQIRVDKALQKLFPALSVRHIEEALQTGLVRVDGKKIKKGDRLNPDCLDVTALNAHLVELQKGNSDLKIPVLWESADEWVVDKPAGMPSHPLSLFDRETPTHWAFARAPQIAQDFPQVQPTITPHRLDTGTSGVLVVCKTQKAFQSWRERFQKKEVKKKYLAWCFNEATTPELNVSLLIGHCPTDARKMLVVVKGTKVREPILVAETSARWIKNQEGMSLWEVQCTTGVTHQVRVHLAHAGFPLVGDALYDSEYENRELRLAYHQLRASELQWNSELVKADVSEFVRGPSDPQTR